MTTMSQYDQWVHDVTRSQRETTINDDNYQFWHIVTKHGYVVAFTLTFPPRDNLKPVQYTRLMFVFGGKIFNRVWKKKWKPKTITRLANIMVKEITSES